MTMYMKAGELPAIPVTASICDSGTSTARPMEDRILSTSAFPSASIDASQV
jgi:hypothetical protein